MTLTPPPKPLTHNKNAVAPPLTDNEINEIRWLYWYGIRVTDIARMFERSVTAIKYQVRDLTHNPSNARDIYNLVTKQLIINEHGNYESS